MDIETTEGKDQFTIGIGIYDTETQSMKYVKMKQCSISTIKDDGSLKPIKNAIRERYTNGSFA